MENASKALIIAGAILISILIIAIGMYIYSSSTSSINGAIASMDTQEVQAFNSTWTSYEGVKTGSQIKSMISQLIGHANTYEEEPEKVVAIYCEAESNAAGDAVNLAYVEAVDEVTISSATDGNDKEIPESDNVAEDVDGGDSALETYIGNLNNLYTDIQAKHKYKVTLDFNNTSIVRRIIVEYDT